jgi:hypothetical protein
MGARSAWRAWGEPTAIGWRGRDLHCFPGTRKLRRSRQHFCIALINLPCLTRFNRGGDIVTHASSLSFFHDYETMARVRHAGELATTLLERDWHIKCILLRLMSVFHSWRRFHWASTFMACRWRRIRLIHLGQICMANYIFGSWHYTVQKKIWLCCSNFLFLFLFLKV